MVAAAATIYSMVMVTSPHGHGHGLVGERRVPLSKPVLVRRQAEGRGSDREGWQQRQQRHRRRFSSQGPAHVGQGRELQMRRLLPGGILPDEGPGWDWQAVIAD